MRNKPTAHVLVLGDVTRSPRILSQAHYLAKEGWSVTVSGHDATKSLAAKSHNMKALDIINVPDLKKYLFISSLALLMKFVLNSLVLLCHLIWNCRSQVILAQTPPAVPTFLILWLFIRITGKKLVIDWHNYGFTLLELTTKPGGFASRIYRLLELEFASRYLQRDVEHLCVSQALQKDLSNWNLTATVYYDRAPDEFRPTSVDVAHELFLRLQTTYSALADPSGSPRRTRFTEITALPTDCGGTTPQWRRDRPALVVSSCSWTPDDDFTMMIKALDAYNRQASDQSSQLPSLVFAVTGRGPLKAHYEEIIREKCWTHVEVIMPWLDPEDYPVFLGCADLGISLHRSSSGLDLPMKVVDLLGVEVPVLALSYPTLLELLPKSGLGAHFHDHTQLANQMCRLLKPGSDKAGRNPRAPSRFDAVGSNELRAYREALSKRNQTMLRGQQYWRKVGAAPIFRAVEFEYSKEI